mgnify:CR=1 FL=1
MKGNIVVDHSKKYKQDNERKKPEVTKGCCVPKGWGEEIIIENNDLYCGKMLIFNQGCKFSLVSRLCNIV